MQLNRVVHFANPILGQSEMFSLAFHCCKVEQSISLTTGKKVTHLERNIENILIVQV